ncbi:DUF2292 domain-containing protein [Luteimonas aestuarii]|uniref:DUF2292 domain-containing protein n=1 Tax=Luteimonas aestuarii TaxID=453837 RepID=A0A4R5U1K4_9GAMM|nr:YezD family protein [Luteimonas aestuarii]TDK27444.1 DUF2292 domain-containing protein [Luteimonas aestuarii]
MGQPPVNTVVALLPNEADAPPPAPSPPPSEAERAVLEALRGIAYGQVEVVVHSSRIVQITRSQKVRLDNAP